MADRPDTEARLNLLLERVNELRREVDGLRSEVARLRGAPVPAQRSPDVKPAPVPAPRVQAPAAPRPAPQIPPPQRAAGPLARLSAEQFVGEELLHYIGVLLVAMGIAFFLLWRAAHAGPMERVVMSALAGAALVALGSALSRRPPYDKLSNGIAGGGWTILYLTAYAAYHFEGTRVLSSGIAELALLSAAALGMIGHALHTGSKAFRLYSFGLTYFVFFLCRGEVPSFGGFLILLAASCAVAVETGHADILLVSVIGYYVNYLPLLARTIATPEGARSLAAFLSPFGWLAAGYLWLAALPLAPQAKRLMEPEERGALDAALSLNAAAFAVLASVMGMEYFHRASLLRAGALSLFLTVPGLLYLVRLPRDFGPGSVCPALGLLVLAGGIVSMPSPLWKMLAWIAAASLWTWIGLLFDHTAWRVSGLAMGLLTFGFFFHVSRLSEAMRRSASMSLFCFSGLSYLASRWYRLWLKGELKDWERPAMEYWLYVGSAALILGLWGVLDPAPLAVTLAALAVIGEFAAVYFGRTHLWGQASALMVAVGAYTFVIDYGPNLEVLAGMSPRLLTASCVSAAMAYLYYADPTPPEFTKAWGPWSQKGHRAALSWVLAAVAAFTVYQEFDPRLRLPVWALGATVLYFLGRYRDEENLKSQAIALALATGVEGAFSYLLAPRPLLGPAAGYETMLYWGSALVLLANLSAAKDMRRPRTMLDHQASWVVCAVALGMMAFYLAKELERYHLTLAWSAEGMVFLVAGMALGYAELRLPSLLLLGICVAKAMLIDTSQLPLPHRVATFLVLGAILLGASMMYVQAGKNGAKTPPPGPS